MFTFSKPAVQGMHRSSQTEHNPHPQDKCALQHGIFLAGIRRLLVIHMVQLST